MKTKKKNAAQGGTVRMILKYLKRYHLLILFSALLALASVAISVYVPIRIGNAIDLIIGKNNVDLQKILYILIEISLFILAGGLITFTMTKINNRITFSVTRDMRNETFTKLQSLPVSYIDKNPHGDLVSRMISDVDQFADGLLLGFTQLFTGLLTIVGTLCFMIVLNYKIALVVFLLTPLSLFIARFIATRTHAMFTAQAVAKGEQTSLIDEMVGNKKLVHAFGYEERAIARFEQINQKLYGASLKAIFFSSLTNPTTRFINNVIYAAVALVGGYTCIATVGTASPFTIGMLSAMLVYVNQYTKPFNEISGVITEFQNALACAERIFSLRDAEAEEPDLKDATVLTDAKGEVTFRDVSFSYTEDKPLIRDISLDLHAGQHIAIVGPTGCGKTTLINLLMRFYDVKAGAILIDGKDIRTYTKNSLRDSFGMVLQDSWIQSATVAENIALGCPDASRERIIEAAKKTHAHGFIKRLPNGYDTLVGEGGIELSAGQKQLISIARVMLLSPPMLILDEATSSIDTRTEILIQKAFDLLMEGRTSFIVAHRLSTIRDADVILVMKDGNIIESGSHEALLSQGGFYKKLYYSQFVGATEDA
ncbi:MAG: ABC transporter ATP-binding protein [Clostridia bacterium]|nr:ABC transporter ATP-binding protein [Clostridia bacterium]